MNLNYLINFVFLISADNKERLILYLLVSTLGSLLSVFLVLSCRLYLQKRCAIKRAHDDGLQSCSPIEEFNVDNTNDNLLGITGLEPSEISISHANGHSHSHSHGQHNLQNEPLLSPEISRFTLAPGRRNSESLREPTISLAESSGRRSSQTHPRPGSSMRTADITIYS